MHTFDVDFYLLFGRPDRAIDVEFNVEDNQVPEESKHSDDTTITDEQTYEYSSSTPIVNF